MSTFGTPTDVAELFDALVTRARTATGYDPKLVFWTLYPDSELVKTPPGKTFVTLRPGRMAPNLAQVAGGGVASFDGRVLVQLWHKLDTDQQARAGGTLTDASRGVAPQWLKVLAALHLFAPENATGGQITTEPLRLAPEGVDFAPRPPQDWLRLDSVWQVKFVHRLS